MYGNKKGDQMKDQYLLWPRTPGESRKGKSSTVRRKPLGSGLRTRPLNRLNADDWSAASKHCKRMQLPVLLTQTEAPGVRFFCVLRKQLRASGTQVSEAQAKLNLNIKNAPEK